MKTSARLGVIALALGSLACRAGATGEPGERAPAPPQGLALPASYRDWRLISVAHEKGKLNDLRAVLGNDAAIAAYRGGRAPFPDGSVIVRLAWDYRHSPENDAAFARAKGEPRLAHPQSFVAGAPKNGVQLMIKDSRAFATSGGWGFAQFDGGEPADAATHAACLPCHEAARASDYVFTRYAP